METTTAAPAQGPEDPGPGPGGPIPGGPTPGGPGPGGPGPAGAGVPAEERPRERLARLGPDALAAGELVAVLLGTGTRGRSAIEVAQGLLEEAGGLRRLSTRTMREIAAAHGLGDARAARVMAAFALGRQVSQLRLAPGARFRSGADIFRHYHGRLRDLRKEQFWEQVLNPLSYLT